MGFDVKSRGFALLLGGFAVVVAGCAGAGQKSVPCPAVDEPLFRATLVQPPNGAVGVAVTLGSIVAQPAISPEPTLAGNTVLLTTTGGATIDGGAFVATSPVPVPGGSSAPTYAASIPVLTAHTTYQVGATSITSFSGCVSNEVWQIGSFTTQ
jgi:hypothetical protein